MLKPDPFLMESGVWLFYETRNNMNFKTTSGSDVNEIFLAEELDPDTLRMIYFRLSKQIFFFSTFYSGIVPGLDWKKTIHPYVKLDHPVIAILIYKWWETLHTHHISIFQTWLFCLIRSIERKIIISSIEELLPSEGQEIQKYSKQINYKRLFDSSIGAWKYYVSQRWKNFKCSTW